MKKYLKKSIISLTSNCVLSFITVLAHSWGSAADILAFLPRSLYLLCMTIRASFAPFTNHAGRLPRPLTVNASSIYDTADLLIRAILGDYSVTKQICSHPTRPTRGVCYEKQQVQQMTDAALPCIRRVMKNTAPEVPEIALFGLSSLMRRTTHSAVATFAGWYATQSRYNLLFKLFCWIRICIQ